jgi:hypothetical protein
MGNGLSLSNYYENYENGFTNTHCDDTDTNMNSLVGNTKTQKQKQKGFVINFEDVQTVIGATPHFHQQNKRNREYFLLINTLSAGRQDCLIRNTVLAKNEEVQINDILSGKNEDYDHTTIIIYGKNASDDTVMTKYNQLKTLGVTNVFIYLGGMFEWLILQDIYGTDLFPTTTKCSDFLEYRPTSIL